jgi:hypothetical protein
VIRSLMASWPAVRSRRRQPCGRQHQGIVHDDQPALAHRVGTGTLEVRHLPVPDLGCLREFAKGERSDNPASLVIYDDPQQPTGKCLRRLFAWAFPLVPCVCRSASQVASSLWCGNLSVPSLLPMPLFPPCFCSRSIRNDDPCKHQLLGVVFVPIAHTAGQTL